MFMYNPIGKTLDEVARETPASFCGGYSVMLLKDNSDATGVHVETSYSVRDILASHPEIAQCRVKYENDFFGTTVLRVIKE